MSNELDMRAINEIALGTKRLMATVDGVITRMDIMQKENDTFKEFMTKQEQINNHLETSVTLRRKEQKIVRTKVAVRTFEVLGLPEDRGTWTKENHKDYAFCFGRLRSKLYHDMYNRFDVTAYADIPSKDFISVGAFIDQWYPEGNFEEFKAWCYKQAEAKVS